MVFFAYMYVLILCECIGGIVYRGPKQSMLLIADLSVDPYFVIFPFMSSMGISLQQWLAENSVCLFILCSIYSAQLI